jgi:predicted nucleic acid-binding protein
MPVASNTSPISNLAIIGRLSLLQSQFLEMRIPGAVQSELGRLPNWAALAEIQQALQDGWIKPQVLREAKIDGQIPLVKPKFEALRTRSRFFLSPQLQEKVLAIAGE